MQVNCVLHVARWDLQIYIVKIMSLIMSAQKSKNSKGMVGCTVPCIVSAAPLGIGTNLKTVFNVLLLQVAKVLTLSLILVTLWAVCYCVLGEVAMPGDIEARKYNLDILKLFYVRSSSHLCHY